MKIYTTSIPTHLFLGVDILQEEITLSEQYVSFKILSVDKTITKLLIISLNIIQTYIM